MLCRLGEGGEQLLPKPFGRLIPGVAINDGEVDRPRLFAQVVRLIAIGIAVEKVGDVRLARAGDADKAE